MASSIPTTPLPAPVTFHSHSPDNQDPLRIPTIDITDTLRIVLQNPHGINPSHHSARNCITHNQIRNFDIGLLCLPETNVDWSNPIHTSNNHTTFSLYHKSTKLAYSSQRPSIRPASHFYPGGTCTAALGPWVSRVTGIITDPSPMGRWSGLILRGRHSQSTAFITCYRVPDASLSSAGPLTSIRR